jgi:prevent-host-death family protein
MTSHDYHVTMKTVGIADLKARLSEHLRAVKKGRSFMVVDRETPVARLVPVETGALEIRQASRRARDLPASPPAAGNTDSLAVLLEDRQRR